MNSPVSPRRESGGNQNTQIYVLAVLVTLIILVAALAIQYIIQDDPTDNTDESDQQAGISPTPPAIISPPPTSSAASTSTPTTPLKVTKIISPICRSGKLHEATVHLEVDGGIPPYLITPNSTFYIYPDHEEYIKLMVQSQDGQVYTETLQVSSLCTGQAPQDTGPVSIPPPNVDPTATNKPNHEPTKRPTKNP